MYIMKMEARWSSMYLRLALTEIVVDGSGIGAGFGWPGPRRRNEKLPALVAERDANR
jgi:hypothetical protein